MATRGRALTTAAAAMATALTAAAALAGCGAQVGGMVGVSVDAGGQPVAIVQLCGGGKIDGATMYIPDPSKSPGHEEVVGSWKASPPITGFSQFSLVRAGSGWQIDTALQPLRAGVTYSLYGWTRDDTWTAANVEFTSTDLQRLEPGQVRYAAGPDSARPNPDDPMVTVPLAQFRADICR